MRGFDAGILRKTMAADLLLMDIPFLAFKDQAEMKFA